ncbi:MFS transporter [Burkholderiaceae bacterium FT117]|uniref:MFS transporter n=1 Tax=Zeimonas sediminis TaxID=2944268 RepID=UPI0023431BAA|nr:MFS transporter [Zeimonas sediminis]MCM5571372.1 MFS transporter [Zeimonas sediminis]
MSTASTPTSGRAAGTGPAAAAALLPAGAAIRVFLAFAGGYFMSYALRSVNAMISPGLTEEFGLTNAQLGSLSAAYFFAFAALQLPLGIWLDRFGSRRVDASLLLVAAAGCAVFALATGPAMLWAGRALIGAGVSGALMCSLRAFRFWYAAERQQQLAAWMLVAGTLGALVTTVPVQMALPLLGWRGVFWVAALLLAVASAAIFFLLPHEPMQSPKKGESPWAGYLTVFSTPYFWRFVIPAMMIQSSFIAFQSLWIGPWFRQVLGMGLDESARALFAFNMVLMFGYLALGWAAPRLARRGWSTLSLVVMGSVLLLATQLAIAFAGGPLAWLLWLGVAILVTVHTLTQTHVSLVFPEQLTGRAFTAFNLLIFSGMFLAQWLFGVLVDALGGSAGGGEGFRGAMMVWVALQGLSLLVLVLWRVSPPRHEG